MLFRLETVPKLLEQSGNHVLAGLVSLLLSIGQPGSAGCGLSTAAATWDRPCVNAAKLIDRVIDRVDRVVPLSMDLVERQVHLGKVGI